MKRDDVAEQIVESVFGEDPALEVFRNEAGFVGFEVFAPGVGFQVVGQTVDIDSETGEVIVDGIVLDEPYIKGKTTADGDVSFPVTVDEGKVFVLGDNRPISKDSRFSEVGLIENENIIGKVCYRVYPFNEFGTVE